MAETIRTGGCACGAVRFTTTGEPKRSGLCHCRTCQKAHGTPFYAFVVFARAQVEVTGPSASWQSTPAYDRRFCTHCGSRVASTSVDEVELIAAQFDEPGLFPPQYESWTVRRVPWLAPLDLPQFERDRDG